MDNERDSQSCDRNPSIHLRSLFAPEVRHVDRRAAFISKALQRSAMCTVSVNRFS